MKERILKHSVAVFTACSMMLGGGFGGYSLWQIQQYENGRTIQHA